MKLDFDGDQIEIHTAENISARKDIAKHFNMLINDKDSTAGKFGDYYAYDAKQPTQGDKPLAFMAQAFSKKFETNNERVLFPCLRIFSFKFNIFGILASKHLK